MSKYPLNCAVLKYFTTVESASADNVLEALKGDYGQFRAFTKKGIKDVLMTGVVNGLLEESKVEFDKNGELVIYYYANEESRATINKYLPR